MELEITPDPGPEERSVIERALRRLLARDTRPPAYTSAWRKASLRDAVQADARPRSKRGATRA